MTDTATLITQLRVLAHLTRTEAQVARLRTAQATGDGPRDELQRNASDADARAARVADVLRDLGALPDPVTPVLGRAAALVRGALEQAQPLDEALFGDLALEHQLRDRARHVGALADAAGLPAVRELADDLVAAHTETVGWLYGVLDDVAAGRGAALAASPLQRVAAQVTRTANAPARASLDQAGATVVRAGEQARTAVEETAQRAARAGSDAASSAVAAGGEALSAGQDTLAAGRDAVAQAVDGATRRLTGDTGPDTATPGTETPDTETPDAETPDAETPDSDSGPPVPGFAELSAQAAVASLRTLDRAAAAAALAFERAHGNRRAVVAAARIRAGAGHAE